MKHIALRVIPLVGDLVARAWCDTDLLGDTSAEDVDGDLRYHVSNAIDEAASQWEEEAGLPFMTVPDDRLEEAKELLLKRLQKHFTKQDNSAARAVEDAIADGIVCVPSPEYYRSV